MNPRAMVLAAGLGTRLRPLTDERAKPLVPVGDRPLLAHIAARLTAHGFPEAALNVHHRPEDFYFGIDTLGAIFHPIHEKEILGTAGGIHAARPLFGAAPILVWNGDILVEPPVGALMGLAAGGGLAFAVAPRPAGEGTVGLGRSGEVVRLRGERFGEEMEGGDYAGVAALGAEALAALPARGCLVGDFALPLLRGGGSIHTARVSGGFRDVGSLASYHAACLAWLETVAGASRSWVHPSARVGSGVVLRRSIIASGAVVEGDGTLERCVLWPGAHARAPLADTIVTSAGREVPL